MVEKTVNAKVKVGLQPSSETREINSRCPKRYKPSVKKNKDNIYWKHRDKASNRNKKKAKFYNPLSANQPQTQASKKCQKSWQKSHLATRINATEVAMKYKDKEKVKNLSHIKYYICKQKSHYTNKCPEKSKNLWRSWQTLHRWLRRRKKKNKNGYLLFGVSSPSRMRLRPC